MQSDEQVPVDGKIPPPSRIEPAVFPDVAKQYDVSLLRYVGAIDFGVLVRGRVSF